MREIFTIIASLLAISSGVPYIRDTLKGKTKPNIVTWTTWSLLNAINAAAAISDGAVQTGIFSGAAALITAAIAILGFKKGSKKYTVFDISCQATALLGIVLWRLTNHPELAVGIVVFVDFIGGLPTARHAWRAPHEETWRTFALAAFAGAVFLATLRSYTFVSMAFPLYIFLFDSTLVATILLRGKTLRARAEKA